MTNISIYSKATDTKSKKTIPLDLFFEGIKDGKWQDIVLPIRTISDKDARTEAKKKAPAVTIAGQFSERSDTHLEKHSGFLAIDIDDVEDLNHLKSLVCADKYVYAAFVSISGRGLCVVLKINPAKHREAFQGASEYFYNEYKLILDPTSINVSRLRFVSYDPDMYMADACEKFALYPKNKPPKKVDKTVFAKDDFTSILDQIVQRRLNMCENYHEWLRIAFAFCHHFSESGREYFHIVSQYSSKYDSALADKQYSACLKQKGSNTSTIATFYYYCKLAGISVYSERTRKIAYTASYAKRSGLSPEQVVENLEKFADISGPDVPDLVAQVINNDIQIKGEDSLHDQFEIWMRQNYDLRKNSVTLHIENHGEQVDQTFLNGIFWQAKKILDKSNYEMVDKFVHGPLVDKYDPFKEFIEKNKDRSAVGVIEQLFSSVKTKDDPFFLHFGRKWFVGIISAIHGKHSPLMLVLTGGQSTGKTEFFRRLLPAELHDESRTYPDYYAESKLDLGKDDEIMMTQKLIIMDDEMGGKSKKESKRLKELTSKQTFSLREPYGRHNVDLRRLAVLCGTTNDNEILNDPTGNRRIIPIHVESIDYASYNKVDKVALFMEAYRLWADGFPWQLDRHDIAYLNKDANEFEASSMEKDLIIKYFEPCKREDPYGEFKTGTDIKVFLDMKSGQKLYHVKIGQELKAMGFIRMKDKKDRFGFWVKPVTFQEPVDKNGFIAINGPGMPF